MLKAWRYFYDTFHGSETILWARAQYIFFLVYTGMQAADVSVFISDHRMLQCYIIMNAIITEATRRRREQWQQ